MRGIVSETPLATLDGRFGFVVGLCLGGLVAMMIMFPAPRRTGGS